MVQAVLFDLDETLLDRSLSVRMFLLHQHARYLDHWAHVPLETFQARFWELDSFGYVHKSIVYRQLLEEFEIEELSAEALMREFYRECNEHAQPFAGMVETLEALRARGLKLGIVTNGQTEMQSLGLSVLGLNERVDAVLISEAEGLRKPDPALFARAAERLGVAPEACLYVGDHPRNDIHGARTAGMKTAWFPNSVAWIEEVERADHEICHLRDILTFV
ncbi:HAD family hydrolase [Tumebacillus sp. ITR2]|uniref:HAD family hydrolase n=1 Tax=Tumebacillus amylolyticus TaxID=2801339 RepID=A0ABS1JC04_9BACL|nr:HAD family hydrolase [Tumebacillus amylolyticus]MBL0387803.1 HAD family hydrolase [Tumebacillus amylolyticus]